ncbi:MAG TPA: hypothetical protein VNY74_12065, partial [Edaphobacter sp.]|nr:hypothetical protein [Edaphobacter sp.]
MITLQDLLKGRSKAIVRESERLRLLGSSKNGNYQHDCRVVDARSDVLSATEMNVTDAAPFHSLRSFFSRSGM